MKTLLRLFISLFITSYSSSPGWAQVRDNNPVNNPMPVANAQPQGGINNLPPPGRQAPANATAAVGAINTERAAAGQDPLTPAQASAVGGAIRDANSVKGSALPPAAALALGRAVADLPADTPVATRNQLVNAAVWGSQFVRGDFSLTTTANAAQVVPAEGASTQRMQIIVPGARPTGPVAMTATAQNGLAFNMTNSNLTPNRPGQYGSGQFISSVRMDNANAPQNNAFNGVQNVAGHQENGGAVQAAAPNVQGRGTVDVTFNAAGNGAVNANWNVAASPGASQNPAVSNAPPATNTVAPPSGTNAPPQSGQPVATRADALQAVAGTSQGTHRDMAASAIFNTPTPGVYQVAMTPVQINAYHGSAVQELRTMQSGNGTTPATPGLNDAVTALQNAGGNQVMNILVNPSNPPGQQIISVQVGGQTFAGAAPQASATTAAPPTGGTTVPPTGGTTAPPTGGSATPANGQTAAAQVTGPLLRPDASGPALQPTRGAPAGNFTLRTSLANLRQLSGPVAEQVKQLINPTSPTYREDLAAAVRNHPSSPVLVNFNPSNPPNAQVTGVRVANTEIAVQPSGIIPPTPGSSLPPPTGVASTVAPTGPAAVVPVPTGVTLPAQPTTPTGDRGAPTIPTTMVNAVASGNGGNLTSPSTPLAVQVTPTAGQSLLVVQTPPSLNNALQTSASGSQPVQLTVVGTLNGAPATINVAATANREQEASGPVTGSDLASRNGTLSFTVPQGFQIQSAQLNVAAPAGRPVPTLTFAGNNATLAMTPRAQGAAPAVASTPANSLNTATAINVVPATAIEFAGVPPSAVSSVRNVGGEFRFLGSVSQLPAGSPMRAQIREFANSSNAPAGAPANIRAAMAPNSTANISVYFNSAGVITSIRVPRATAPTTNAVYMVPDAMRDRLLAAR